MTKIAIVGFGRFGSLLAKLAQDSFDVAIIEADPVKQEQAQAQGYTVIPPQLIAKAEIVFLAVPISKLESSLQSLATLLIDDQVVIDLCSVKVYPAAVMQQYIGHCQLLASHPMFGPDSAELGLAGLQVALCPLSISARNLQIIKDFWTKKGCEIIETTPQQHDQDTIYSQAFTYSLAKLILNTNLPDVTLQTRSFQSISRVAELSANDSEQLFHDMLFYNPYFADMKQSFDAALAATSTSLDDILAEQSAAKHTKS
jgi:prephenate dehydrogenase